METFRFLALSGLDMKNIHKNAYFHMLNSENWQEKKCPKKLSSYSGSTYLVEPTASYLYPPGFHFFISKMNGLD